MSGSYFRSPAPSSSGQTNQSYGTRAIIWRPVINPLFNPFNPTNVLTNLVSPLSQCIRPVYSYNNLHLNLHSCLNPLTNAVSFHQPHYFPNISSRFAMSTSNDNVHPTESPRDSVIFGEKRKLDDDNDPKDRKKVKQETKALKAKRPGFTEERYNETSYYEEDGLRKVYPYYFTFTTFCKGRWVGQPILEIFAKEFRAHPPEEYERCIKSGTLTVNYKTVDIDYKLQHNDLLANTVHRHEVPVLASPIKLVFVGTDLVVVDKPCSLPVHPCGRYRHNTVVFILAKEFNLKNLRTIHRLDRLTSGLLLFGRSLKKARQLEHEIRTRLVIKEYVCRVVGEFPDETIICEEPIEVVSYKIGVCRVGPNGKECKTEFTRLSYNGHSSVVLCKPKTGRMHQIRVHLQYLGYPIVNDPLYNHSVFGPQRGKGGHVDKSNDELISELIRIHNAENWLGINEDGDDFILPKPATPIMEENKVKDKNEDQSAENLEEIIDVPKSAQSDSSSPKPETSSTEKTQSSLSALEESKLIKDSNCYECRVKFRDPKPQDLVMYLHAWRYKGPDWEYETKLPEWANENWVEVIDTSK